MPSLSKYQFLYVIKSTSYSLIGLDKPTDLKYLTKGEKADPNGS
jgi:hypothetical protein